MTTATYDMTYLTQREKVRALAVWILTSNDPVAAAARRAMGTLQNPRPSDPALNVVYGFLYSQKSDPEALIRAYCASR